MTAEDSFPERSSRASFLSHRVLPSGEWAEELSDLLEGVKCMWVRMLPMPQPSTILMGVPLPQSQGDAGTQAKASHCLGPGNPWSEMAWA